MKLFLLSCFFCFSVFVTAQVDTGFVTNSNYIFQSLPQTNNRRVTALEHEIRRSNQLIDNKLKFLSEPIDTNAFARLGGNTAKLATATTERFGVGMNTTGGVNKSFNVGINPSTGYSTAIGGQNLFGYDMYNPSGKTYASLHRAANGDKRFLYSQKSTQAGTGAPAYYDYALVKDSATGANIQFSEFADNNGLYRKIIKTGVVVGATLTNQKEFRQSNLPTGVPSDLPNLADGSFEFRQDSGRFFVKTTEGVNKIAFTSDLANVGFSENAFKASLGEFYTSSQDLSGSYNLDAPTALGQFATIYGADVLYLYESKFNGLGYEWLPFTSASMPVITLSPLSTGIESFQNTYSKCLDDASYRTIRSLFLNGGHYPTRVFQIAKTVFADRIGAMSQDTVIQIDENFKNVFMATSMLLCDSLLSQSEYTFYIENALSSSEINFISNYEDYNIDDIYPQMDIVTKKGFINDLCKSFIKYFPTWVSEHFSSVFLFRQMKTTIPNKLFISMTSGTLFDYLSSSAN